MTKKKLSEYSGSKGEPSSSPKTSSETSNKPKVPQSEISIESKAFKELSTPKGIGTPSLEGVKIPEDGKAYFNQVQPNSQLI